MIGNSKEELSLKYIGVLASENSEIKTHIETRNTARNRFYRAFIELLKIHCDIMKDKTFSRQ